MLLWIDLSVGLDPSKSTIFIQSQIPELAELSMYYMNFGVISTFWMRNPNCQDRDCSKGDLEKVFQTGFLVYPIAQSS